MTNRPEPMFKQGDTVTIVSEPYLNCPHVWIDKMNKYLGVTTTIQAGFWVTDRDCYAYKISADGMLYMWCENCFEFSGFSEDIEESDVDFNILFQ